MKIQVSILAVPQRVDEFAQPLFAKMQEEAKGTGHTVHLNVDDGRGYWENLKLCWKPQSPEVTHLIVFDEDVVTCRDFLLTAENTLLTFDTPTIISYFVSNKRQIKAAEQGKHWIRISVGGNPAMAMPVSMGRIWTDWFEANRRNAPEGCFGKLDIMGKPMVHGDAAIGWFAKSFKIPIQATVPSIVQHIGNESSVLGHTWSNWRERGINTARVFVGEEMSGLGLEWW